MFFGCPKLSRPFRPGRILQAVSAALLVSLLAGCSPSLKDFPFAEGVSRKIDPDNPRLQIQYFSVGCFYIQYGETAMLTDPFWSHLPMSQVVFGKLKSDPKQIEPHLPPLHKVKAVMVGHGHYDHMLDLPYISPKLNPTTEIFGSEGLKHELAPYDLDQVWMPCDSLMATEDRPGTWVWLPDSSARILPIRSAHPPHFMGIKLYHKNLDHDLDEAPRRTHQYKEGQTLAWLIDYMAPDRETIVYRLYHETSSEGYPAGWFPPEILDERGIDIAMITIDCYRNVCQGKHNLIDFLQPKVVIYNHWEDFFRKKSKPPKPIVRIDLWGALEYAQRDSAREYIFPFWDEVYRFD